MPPKARAPVTPWEAGALSPGLSSGPTRVSGFPLNVTALARFCMVWTSDCASRSRYGCGEESPLGSVRTEIRRELAVGGGSGRYGEHVEQLQQPRCPLG